MTSKHKRAGFQQGLQAEICLLVREQRTVLPSGDKMLRGQLQPPQLRQTASSSDVNSVSSFVISFPPDSISMPIFQRNMPVSSPYHTPFPVKKQDGGCDSSSAKFLLTLA